MIVTGGVIVTDLAVVSNSPTASVQPWYFDDNAVLNPWTGVIPNTHTMLHNEHLRKADESYEIRHDHNGNAIHVFITDGEAIIFPTLHDLILRVYFGEEVERFYVSEADLSTLYESRSYSYYDLKAEADRLNQLPPPPDEVHIVI